MSAKKTEVSIEDLPDEFNTRHGITGKLQVVTKAQYLVFQDVLEIVPDDAKEVVEGMFDSGTVDERAENRIVEPDVALRASEVKVVKEATADSTEGEK